MISPLRFTPSYLLSGIACLLLQPVNGTAQTVLPVDKVHVRFAKGEVKKTDSAGKVMTTNEAKATVVNDPAEYPGSATVRPGGTLSTGSGATAVISIPDAGAFKMGPDTEVKVPENISAGHSLELMKGRLFFDISADDIKKRGNATFRLKTPAALLAVKGTQFFASSSSGTEIVGVHEGSVGVYKSISRQLVTLESGEAVPLNNRRPLASRPLTETEKALRDQYGALEGYPFYCQNLGAMPQGCSGYVTFETGKAIVHLDYAELVNIPGNGEQHVIEAVQASFGVKLIVQNRITWNTISSQGVKTKSKLHLIDNSAEVPAKVLLEAVKFEIPIGNLRLEDLENRAWVALTVQFGPRINATDSNRTYAHSFATTFIGGKKKN